MSHDSSAAHSPYSSPRYPPSSRSPTSHRSPLPSAPLSGHDAERSSSDNYLFPAPAYHPYGMNFATGYPTFSPSPNLPPTYATWPWPGHYSAHPTNWFPPPPPTPLVQAPFSQGPYHPVPATNTWYPNYPPVQPSITIHQPDSTYQNHAIHQRQRQHQHHTPQQVTQQGQTYSGKGMFNRSQNLSFSDNTFIDNSITSESTDIFMDKLLQHTIIGAEFDSSDRHPPPRCHPGTRLAIIERCKNFIDQYDSKEKMRWVVGAAGVGKSAIMQIVAEEIPADASVFFSVNGRNNGTKIFATIAYQLAVKYEPYRHFIRNAINHDPSLLTKSLPAQFQKFIIDPFIRYRLLNPSQRLVIIIDGLDECENPKTQEEILGLISNFCIKYSASPVVWFVASRPEPHITSFFDKARVTPAYTKEEVEIDSDEACAEVQKYLRDELNEIKLAYPTLRQKREWPTGLEFTKIATAAGGLFAYASTVVRFIGKSHYRDPATLLCHVLEVIDAGFEADVSSKDHPMALLDSLYRRILENIPPDVMIDTRKLLLTIVNPHWAFANYRRTCNILGLSEAAAYSAVSYLHAVLKVPAPDKADGDDLKFFHKSFFDFLFDFKRSSFSHNAKDESEHLLAQCLLRIVEHVSNDFIDSIHVDTEMYGDLRGCLGFCGNIPLSWPGDERFLVADDDDLRLTLYRTAMCVMCENFPWCRSYSSISFFHALATRFNVFGSRFPIYDLRDCAFGQFRSELTELGKLKEVPLRTLDYAAIFGGINIRFTSPIGTDDAKDFDRWNPSCEHVKDHMDGLPQQRVWTTYFRRQLAYDSGDDMTHVDIPRFNIMSGKVSHLTLIHNSGYTACLDCSRRLAHHFDKHPDQLATVFVDSTEMSYVELSFVDPVDGVSEWRYQFFHFGRPSYIN